MKFCDKLIQLRKRNGLSQEELGEKLNVTRQTVSKWELGQTKPESDKLLEISKLFNVDFNLLMDDTIKMDKPNNNEHFISDDLNPRRWLLVVLIVIAIIIVVILGGKFVSDRTEKKKNGIFDLFNFFDSEIIDESISGMKDSFGKDSFNNSFDFYLGTSYGMQVGMLLDEIITNNKTNSNRLVTVKFDDISTTDPTEIKNIKVGFGTGMSDRYEVSAEYDENGYINEIIIEKYKDATSAKDFNWDYEIHNGTQYGINVGHLLDDVITNNKTNSEQILRVKFNDIDTTDTNEIRNIKKSLDDWTKYEVIFDYDEDGYIYLITIEV